MRVRISATGLLEEYLPEAGSEAGVTLEVPEAATLLAVMSAAGIPESVVPIIALNGVVVPRSEHADRVVLDDDEVCFMPNLKGG